MDLTSDCTLALVEANIILAVVLLLAILLVGAVLFILLDIARVFAQLGTIAILGVAIVQYICCM